MKKFISVLLLGFVLFLSPAEAQHRVTGKGQSSISQSQDPIDIFNRIQSGIASSNVSLFSTYLSDQTYFSLFSGLNGYYSVNQSYYLLQDFFNIYRPLSFKFKNIKNGKSPYATGVLSYESKSKREVAQVYVSLEKTGTDWKISQITIK